MGVSHGFENNETATMFCLKKPSLVSGRESDAFDYVSFFMLSFIMIIQCPIRTSSFTSTSVAAV